MAIVVGYVATIEGRAALDAAVRESRLRGGPIVVVVSTRSDDSPERRADLETALAAVDAELAGLGIEREIRLLDGGDVADDLITAAEETAADVVVIGLRRRSPVGKLILGANAQRVLFDAPCPVLTVKPDL